MPEILAVRLRSETKLATILIKEGKSREREKIMREQSVFTHLLAGLASGVVVAVATSWFVSSAYRDGSLLAPLFALALALGIPSLLYDSLEKRLTFGLFAAALLSGFSFLVLVVGGQPSGLTVLGLSLLAVALAVGTDLAFQDLGTRVKVSPRFSYGAIVTFLIVVLPLSIHQTVREHHVALQEDDALIRTVAQHIHPQGDTIVFESISPRQQEQLKKLVSVRTKEKIYTLADAEVESVVEERTVRRQNRKQPKPAVISRKQEERMRLILSLQGASVPDDITLFSQRGPVTTSELTIALEKKNPG
jgi:hypothetical protein